MLWVSLSKDMQKEELLCWGGMTDTIGVAKNFDWEGEIEKFCDVILVT